MGVSEEDQVGAKLPEESRFKVRVAPIAAVAAAAVIAAVAIAALALPGQSPKIGKDDFDTAAALERAIAIDNLSVAEFVYDGIAEHYREGDAERNPLFFWENDDPVDYRICYKASVKAGIDMGDVGFDVDEAAKTVKAKLPEISLSCTVDPNDMQFIPEATDADMQAVFQLCEDDVESEARQSEKLLGVARENLRRTIEALTQPVIAAGGYTMSWDEGE